VCHQSTRNAQVALYNPALGKTTNHRDSSSLASAVRWAVRSYSKQLRIDPSYVCRVAKGQRNSEEITQALEAEMKRLEKVKPR
jgi:hypothetical protein